MKTMLRSAVALLAGFVSIFVLSIATDMLLEGSGYLTIAPGSHNQMWVLAFVLVCRSLYFVLGGCLAAYLAPAHSLRHALIIGTVGVAFNSFGAAMTWTVFPHGFALALIVLAFVGSWLGGKLAARGRDDAGVAVTA